jgi:hypothetical protein
MNKELKNIILSYLDGECSNPEIVEDILKQNEEAKDIYAELEVSKNIKKLEYQEYNVPFDKIIPSAKRQPIKRLLVTAGAVAISILFLLPLLKTSHQLQQFKNRILTEAMR